MAVLSKELLPIPTLTWKKLYKTEATYPMPFTLGLADGSLFHAEELIRLVPFKRLIAYGHWQRKPVFAKVFFNPKRAQKNFEKEIENIKSLQHKNMLTPALYFYGQSQDKKIWIILFERINRIDNLSHYRNQPFEEQFFLQLLSVVKLIALQHQAGVFQNDTHLNNFLLSDQKIYTIDGAKMEFSRNEIPKARSIMNLAWFFYDFGSAIKGCEETIFAHYAKARHWVVEKCDYEFFSQQIKLIRKNRWQRLAKKLYKGSSDLLPVRGWQHWGVCARNHAHVVVDFMKRPEKILQASSSVLIKKLPFSTTFKVQLNQQTFIVKRYQGRGVFLKASPAAKAWRVVHKLDFFGVRMLTPVAFFEKRSFGRCTESYVIFDGSKSHK